MQAIQAIEPIPEIQGHERIDYSALPDRKPLTWPGVTPAYARTADGDQFPHGGRRQCRERSPCQ